MRLFFGILFASVAAFAAGDPAVYSVGNLTGVEIGAEGFLTLNDSKAVFRSGKSSVEIPYKHITNTELGAKITPPSDVPVYKFWELHKRLPGGRPVHQMLTIEFNAKDGAARTMTLEMEEAAAAQVIEQLDYGRGLRHRTRNNDAWWGDSLWRTTRNENTLNPERLGNSPVK
jgi:hypothetical protein